MTPAIASLVWITLASAACPPLPDPIPDIDDRALQRRTETRATRLLSAGLGVDRAELERELLRDGAELWNLPKPASGEVLTHESLYARRARSVLNVQSYYKCDHCPKWHDGGEATAFVIAEGGICASNHHVFEGDDSQRMVVTTVDGEVLPIIEVLAASEADDVAIFRVQLGKSELRPIPMRAAAPTGTPVGLISHPSGRHWMFSSGIIARRASRKGALHPGTENSEGGSTPIVNVTCEYGVGSSGGPILDMHGNVVAMVSATEPIYADREAKENIQMVVRICVAADRIIEIARRQRLVDPAADQTP
jgi:serine protease Do